MPSATDHLIVITGGPGCGKTTLLSALAEAGFTTVPESARSVIQEEIAAGGEAPPWADQGRFAQAIFERDLAKWRGHAAQPGPIFFDRALPEAVGIWTFHGLPVPEAVSRAIAERRYNPLVFVAPYWAEIYHQDAERKQTHEEAEFFARASAEAYEAAGYRTLVLPRVSVAERAAFVRQATGR